MKNYKLAMIQMKVQGGEKKLNLNNAKKLINEAISNGASVVLLPECMDLGWTSPTSQTMAESIPDGSVCKTLAKLAKDNSIYICSGLTEKDGDKVYNSSVIINKQGEVICKHRKLNELEIGHEYYAHGDRINVIETEYGTFGLMICADARTMDHNWTRALCHMGADVILSPTSWAVGADHNNIENPYGNAWRNAYIPEAKEFGVYIIGTSNVGNVVGGPWAGWNCIGCSLAIGPNGEEILQGPYGVDAETILYVDIKPRKRSVRGSSWNK